MTMAKQLVFERVLYRPIERQFELDQIRYRKPILIIQRFLEYFMQIRPQAPILITPNYPVGWYAEVAAEDKVWTIECDRGEIKLSKVADLCGFTPNGQFIKAFEEDISANMEEYYQECKYAGWPSDPILCVDFCEDDGENRCAYCPFQRRSLNDKRVWLY